MDGIGSTIAWPVILPPSQISSSWGGFAMRTDWKISDPSPARRRLTAHLPGVRPRCQNRIGPPLQSPQFVGNVNEDGVGEGCGFSGGGKGDDFDGREHLRPHGWMSIRQAQQIGPLSLSYRNPCQPIFPSSPTHAASSAMPQERSLTVVLGPFGYLLCSGHTSTLSVVFHKDAGAHAHRKVDL